MNWPQQIPSSKVALAGSAVQELAGLLMGDLIGEGAYRRVYACPIDPTIVIKFESTCSGRFCNVNEWDLWSSVRENPEIARWFAPVRFISSCGQFLIQDRTKPLARLPLRIPHFMTDIKLCNMGRLGGRPVFHDYANNKCEALALKRLKLVDRL